MQPQARADVIYVQAFDASPDQVKLDSGIAQKLKTMVSGSSSANEQMQAAQAAREEVSDEIVRQLQAKGLNAVRSDAPAPANGNALIGAGNFQKLDEGMRRRRMLIGLGAGKSEVGASVQLLYKPAGSTPVLLETFTADANSGHIPGMAESAGLGAAAGHLTMTAAAAASVHGATEVKRTTLSGDAQRLGDSIAKQVLAANAANGWVPAAHAE
ncbi:hypothetical protein UB46_32460 [Burkholderiaceae bacterium 16]|nr:hypothetical protein UB46_32460 [Burkholderiaceae bacterium 16]